jgi:hypothetical protein
MPAVAAARPARTAAGWGRPFPTGEGRGEGPTGVQGGSP